MGTKTVLHRFTLDRCVSEDTDWGSNGTGGAYLCRRVKDSSGTPGSSAGPGAKSFNGSNKGSLRDDVTCGWGCTQSLRIHACSC